jgi:SAM-dependent methyltransferase
MNNPVFGNYARYYNLLYQDKDYAAEAHYIHELIQKHCPGAGTVLNLGCGTGNHDFELARFGYEITGIDMSDDMLTAANSRLASSGLTISTICFIQDDIRTVRLDKTFDAVISLFHVMSYQTTNDDLQAAVATAKEHLAPGGLFIFDCWYGPAILSDPPVVRIKRLEDEAISVVRIAEPVMHPNENVVDVNYQVMITDKSMGTVEQLLETHRMRYLFLPELELILRDAGLCVVAASEWMTGNSPSLSTWGVCFVTKI